MLLCGEKYFGKGTIHDYLVMLAFCLHFCLSSATALRFDSFLYTLHPFNLGFVVQDGRLYDISQFAYNKLLFLLRLPDTTCENEWT